MPLTLVPSITIEDLQASSTCGDFSGGVEVRISSAPFPVLRFSPDVPLRFLAPLTASTLAAPLEERTRARESLTRVLDNCAAYSGSHLAIPLGTPGEGFNIFTMIESLSILVEHGRGAGVTVSLENGQGCLGRARIFNAILQQSGALATVDIGKAMRAAGGMKEALGLFVEANAGWVSALRLTGNLALEEVRTLVSNCSSISCLIVETSGAEPSFGTSQDRENDRYRGLSCRGQ